jgi:hypothetical protein
MMSTASETTIPKSSVNLVLIIALSWWGWLARMDAVKGCLRPPAKPRGGRL